MEKVLTANTNRKDRWFMNVYHELFSENQQSFIKRVKGILMTVLRTKMIKTKTFFGKQKLDLEKSVFNAMEPFQESVRPLVASWIEGQISAMAKDLERNIPAFEEKYPMIIKQLHILKTHVDIHTFENTYQNDEQWRIVNREKYESSYQELSTLIEKANLQWLVQNIDCLRERYESAVRVYSRGEKDTISFIVDDFLPFNERVTETQLLIAKLWVSLVSLHHAKWWMA